MDENDELRPPTEAFWTLTDDYGTIINNRANVAMSPGSQYDIVLAGDDLGFPEAAATSIRKILIEATYNSNYGYGLPLRDQVTFQIDNLTAVT